MTEESAVLVIEGDQHNADLLKHILGREGYRVIVAEDGQTAQNKINWLPHPPRLVLMDPMLPLVDGYQLLRQIRSKTLWNATKVIVLSAKTQEQDIIRAFELGASDYVTKPFHLGELLARIASQLKTSQCHG